MPQKSAKKALANWSGKASPKNKTSRKRWENTPTKKARIPALFFVVEID